MRARSQFAVVAAVAVTAEALAGCGPSGRMAAPPPPAQPPQLWSIEVPGEQNPGRAVKLCADEHLRSGFTSLSVSIGGQPCAMNDLHRRPTGQNYKCIVGGDEFGVTTNVQGDVAKDFIASSVVTDIDAAKTIYSRTLRFRLLGPCPAGWPIGDATDQQGKRVPAAFIDGTDIPAYARTPG